MCYSTQSKKKKTTFIVPDPDRTGDLEILALVNAAISCSTTELQRPCNCMGVETLASIFGEMLASFFFAFFSVNTRMQDQSLWRGEMLADKPKKPYPHLSFLKVVNRARSLITIVIQAGSTIFTCNSRTEP